MGEIHVGSGLSPLFWGKSKEIDHEGLAVFKIDDVKVFPAGKRN